MKITLIEGLCYLHPHREEIMISSPSMVGVWKECLRLINSIPGSMMAPLLVDDIMREGVMGYQTVEEILDKSIKRKYSDLTWFAKPTLEGDIQKQYGNLGCKIFDSLYHRDIVLPLSMITQNWKWISMNPESFKDQQAGMLLDLWRLIYSKINVGSLTLNSTTKEEIRDKIRLGFLGHFEHRWIGRDGLVSSITHPSYKGKKIIHEVT